MNSRRPSDGARGATATATAADAARWKHVRRSWPTEDVLALTLVLGVAILIWLPRHAGPIDLRWDGAVYYILGTSLAEGKGYKLLNEPGEIDAVQYPPLLPAIAAAHQLMLGTNDPTTVGRWLRLSSFLVFIAYAIVVLRFLRSYLPAPYALLGALLSVFCLFAWYLSDALFPEVWFSVATLLFLMFARKDGSGAYAVLAYVSALASYALRTVGLAAFAVWVLDSLIRRRFRQALVRAMLALIPIAAWQGYVVSVERSDEYSHPAYEYQRAPYLFYNVSYARNIALRDPFTPEKGQVWIARRVVRNALHVPVHLGEALSAPRGYFQMWLHGLFGDGPITYPIIYWGTFTVLSVFGGVLVMGGVGLQLLRRQWIVPLYMLAYLAALCLTPFPGQFLRYLMPIAPLGALSAVVVLSAAGGRWREQPIRVRAGVTLPFAVLGPALLIQVIVAASVYVREYRPIAYVDAKGEPVAYRLFFYSASHRGFDQAVDYVRAHADPTHVIAAGTPHWVYLRAGLKAVMPPFEQDADRAQQLLDSVPVRYLIIGQDVVATERYTVPVVRQFPDRWKHVYSTPAGGWDVWRRVGP